jgi:hypothetical protein
MKFTCYGEMDACLLAYLGFELLSTDYEIKFGRKIFRFEIPETTETTAGTVTNNPTEMLNEWHAGEYVIGDGQELIRRYDSMVRIILETKRKVIARQRNSTKGQPV